MKLLTIGPDKDLLNPDSASAKRHIAYGAGLEKLHAVVFSRNGNSVETIDLATNVHVHPVVARTSLGLMVGAYRVAVRILRDRGEWAVSAQDPFESGFVAYAVARMCRVPLQLQEHGDFFSTAHWRRESLTNRVRYVVGRFLVRHADCVRVVSVRIKRTLMRLGVEEHRISVAAVYTDTAQFAHAVPDSDIVALKKDGELLLVTMARLVPQKNLTLLIDAFGIVRSRGVSAKLCIIGRGPEKDSLVEYAVRHAPEHVVFRDWTPNPAGALTAADVYVLSSNYEGWARVLVEALAAGVPVVTTDVGCVGEVVQDGVHGLAVPIGDTHAFADALERMAGDAALRAACARAAATACADLPTRAQSVEAYLASIRACRSMART